MSWHILKNNAKNQPTPVAVVIGADPTIGYVSVSKMSETLDEFAVAGALRGEAVDLVPCETVPLEVPATAEIVLEGEIPAQQHRAGRSVRRIYRLYGSRRQ